MTADDGGGLRQAERYGGPASDGRRAASSGGSSRPGPSVKSAYVGGFAMIGTTLIAGALGASALLAFFLGLGVFFAVVMAMRPGDGIGSAISGPLKVDRAAAMAAGLDADRADARLAEAESRLIEIRRVASGLGDRPLEDRIRAMTDAARETLSALAADPSDMDRARKFLIVTIPSALASVEKYARLGVRDPALSERFGALMDDVADAARRQRAALRRDDALALEVEMEVLADRLKGS